MFSVDQGYDPLKGLVEKQTIFPLKKVEFEGVTYSAPNDTEEFLSLKYDDYLRFPNDFGVIKHKKLSLKQIEEMSEIANQLE